MKKSQLFAGLLLMTTVVLGGPVDNSPLELRQYQQQRPSTRDAYLRGVVDTINGINQQQRLLGQQPIFCPPPGPYPLSVETARAILKKYASQAAEERSHFTAALPASELILSQLRYDSPCTDEALAHWRTQR